MIYVALVGALGQRHSAMGNFAALWRSVRVLPTAYACRSPAAQPPVSVTASVDVRPQITQ